MRQIIPPQQSVGDFASFSQIIKHVHAKILTAVSDHQELRVSVIELKKIVPPSGPSLICLSFRIAALQISSGIDKPLLVNHRHMPMQPEQNLCPAVVDLRDIIEKAVYFIDIINDCRQNRIAHALIEHMSREIVSVVALRQPLEYLQPRYRRSGVCSGWVRSRAEFCLRRYLAQFSGVRPRHGSDRGRSREFHRISFDDLSQNRTRGSLQP
jgi:hypothetical protein